MGANIRSSNEQVRANVAANVRAHGQPIGEDAGLVGLDVPASVDSGESLQGLGGIPICLRSLKAGDEFRFERAGIKYEYLGNGCYISLHGFGGGPWYIDAGADPIVFVG